MAEGGREFSPGFRFSKLDAAILFVGLFVSADTAAIMFWPGMAIGFVVAHFFLFCNIVRMERSSELIWAAVFVALAAATILTGRPGWPTTFAISLVVTVVLVIFEMRKPSYHGVFWRRVNPNLRQWWEARG
jgi:hypothetical protein